MAIKCPLESLVEEGLSVSNRRTQDKTQHKSVAAPIAGLCGSCRKFYPASYNWRYGKYGEPLCNECAVKDWTLDTQLLNLTHRMDLVAHKKAANKTRTEMLQTKTHKTSVSKTRIAAGQYRQDTHERVFLVIESNTKDGKGLRAGYVYGKRKLPTESYITPACCVTVYELQRKEMNSLVTKNIKAIEGIHSRLCSNAKREGTQPYLSDEDIWDILIDAAMYSAATIRNHTQYMSYVFTTARHAINKECKRRNTQGGYNTKFECVYNTDVVNAHQTEYRDITLAAHEAYEAEINEAVSICKQLLGPVDFYVLCQWAIEGKSLEKIGIELGVIKSSVSMRLKRIREKCGEHIAFETLEQKAKYL